MSSTIEVRVDDRLRLAGALLAAGDWPEREQAAKAYKPHRAAEHAHRYFASHSSHPAVTEAMALVGDGAGLGILYRHALNASWPGELGGHVTNFRSAANLGAFWAESQADWDQARADAEEVLARADLHQFLIDLLGPLPRALVLAPNLLYPGQRSVAASSANEMVVSLPPPLAWGTSHPWRYNERADEVLAKLSEAFARFLFEEAAPGELKPRAEVFALASAVLFLRQAEGDAAGDQFMVMEKKTRGLKSLPAVVGALETILADRRAGKSGGFADYLRQLPLQG